MKYIVGFVFILALSFGNSSCQKEFFLDDVDSSLITPPNLPGLSGSFTATIDGAKYTADKISSASISLGVIVIAGISNAGENITLRVADSGVHVYSLDIGSASNLGAYTKGSEFAYATNQGDRAGQSGGTLSITSINKDKKTISGTFSMNVYRQYDSKQKKITEGVFKDISYETQPIPPANSKDTFRVKVDGTAFPVYSIAAFNLYNMISLTVNDQAAGKTVGITMPTDVKAGTYDFSPFGPDFIGQYNPNSTTYLSASSGKITILEHNVSGKRIKGNFNFEAKEIIGDKKANLTEGYFSITYK